MLSTAAISTGAVVHGDCGAAQGPCVALRVVRPCEHGLQLMRASVTLVLHVFRLSGPSSPSLTCLLTKGEARCTPCVKCLERTGEVRVCVL